jgi:serine/threonine-protein kinase HipA
MSDELAVSLYGTHLGELVRGGDRALFRWSADAERRWGLNSGALSQSLRVGFTSTELTESFFGALLPEGIHLDRLARESKVASDDLVGLLAQVGADLAGALQVGDPREAREPEQLVEHEIALLLDQASGFLVGGGGSALPGFQRKLTLTRRGNGWWRGNGTLPSTHILKPVGAEHRAAVESEDYLLRVGRRLGLVDFESWVEEIGQRHVLVIERYDRPLSGSDIVRIHQEDAGQALGLPWGGGEKFENNDARASLKAVAGLLDTRRTVFQPARPDAEKLLRYTVLNVAGGNTDAHAKNFSLLHEDDGSTRLAPLYDAAPLALAYDWHPVARDAHQRSMATARRHPG